MAYLPYHFVGEVLLHPVYILVLTTIPDDCWKDGTYFPFTQYKENDLLSWGSTAVGQSVACAPVTQRDRGRSPVGTSSLGEVLSVFLLTCYKNVGKL